MSQYLVVGPDNVIQHVVPIIDPIVLKIFQWNGEAVAPGEQLPDGATDTGITDVPFPGSTVLLHRVLQVWFETFGDWINSFAPVEQQKTLLDLVTAFRTKIGGV
jgi:hypothetical protein